jgi:benzoylformate decarboxylase
VTERAGKIAMFEQLAADGITTVFGNPGTVEQGFLDVLEQLPGFDYVLALQETVAVGIADGYARATARPALVQLHTGVGLGNGVGMLYQANRGHSPLVVIAGEAGLRYDAMDSQMAVDLVAMARPVTKWATRVVHPDSLLRVLRRAVKVAMTPPRGPVFVALPMDVLDAPTSEPAVASTVPTRSVLPVAGELARAADLLRGARRPLILMGDGVAVSGAQAELTAVAELLDAPVWAVDSSEVNMDTTHRLYQGQLGHMFGSVSSAAVRDADALLIVGTYVFPEVFPSLDSPFAEAAAIVHVDLDDWEMAKNFPVTVPLVADPRPTLAALVELLSDGTDTAYSAGPPAAGPAGTRPAVGPDGPLAELFAAELADRAGPGLVVVDEALTASPALLRQLPPTTPGDYFLTRGGSLGIGFPGAIGVKLARPNSTVVGFSGDVVAGGGPQCLDGVHRPAVARYDVAAKLVVCNNHRYQLLDANLEQYWTDLGIESHPHPRAFDLSGPDLGFVDIARGLGVPGVRVSEPAEVAGAVRQMLAHPGPFLVDLATGRAG